MTINKKLRDINEYKPRQVRHHPTGLFPVNTLKIPPQEIWQSNSNNISYEVYLVFWAYLCDTHDRLHKHYKENIETNTFLIILEHYSGWMRSWGTNDYSLIAFVERVTFWLQRARSLPCACAHIALHVRLTCNHYAIAHAYNAANTHAQDSNRVRWKCCLKQFCIVYQN